MGPRAKHQIIGKRRPLQQTVYKNPKGCLARYSSALRLKAIARDDCDIPVEPQEGKQPQWFFRTLAIMRNSADQAFSLDALVCASIELERPLKQSNLLKSVLQINSPLSLPRSSERPLSPNGWAARPSGSLISFARVEFPKPASSPEPATANRGSFIGGRSRRGSKLDEGFDHQSVSKHEPCLARQNLTSQ